jgi:hypothetical protein
VEAEFSCLGELAYADIRISFACDIGREMYLSKSLTTTACPLRSTSPGLRERVAHSSSAIDVVGKRIGLHLGCYPEAQLGSSTSFPCSSRALQTKSASLFL